MREVWMLRALLLLLTLLLVLPMLAFSQQVPPSEPGPYGVLVTNITVIQVPGPRILTSGQASQPVVAGTDVSTLLVVFPTKLACDTARNTSLLPSGFEVIVGTGTGLIAHMGRTVTTCFQQP